MTNVRRSAAVRRPGLALLPVALAASALALAACSSSSSGGSSPATSPSAAASTPTSSTPSTSTAAPSGGSSAASASGNLEVWVDAARLPAAKAYQAAHPGVKMKIVTYDGDGNGATSLQAKILLWNRTNSGWPDVIFSEQVNDPIWMSQKPFSFTEPLTGHMSADILKEWPAPSTAQCTVDGKVVCVQDNIAPVVLWYNKKLMDQFGYTTPKTWQEWAALGQKVATDHPGYIVGNIGDSFSHWIYLWGNQCPLQQLQDGGKLLINSTESHCTEMASLLDPLIKNGTVPPLSVFTPDFAKKYGGANSKVLMMPGPAWYSMSLFHDTLHTPAGQITAAVPLQWNSDSPVTTGQVGGGPWVMSNHSKNMPTASDFITWVTTVFNPTGKFARGGLPAYQPLAATWLATQSTNPYFAGDISPALKASANQIWQGWSLTTYPDQPTWSNKVVTALVAGKSLSSQLQPFGDSLTQVAKAAGYSVTNK